MKLSEGESPFLFFNDALARQFERICATGKSAPCPEVFNGIPLKDYQIENLLRFQDECGFAGCAVIDMGADYSLSTSRAMLRLGAKKVYAINPGFPEDLASPDERIAVMKMSGENADLPDSCVDKIFSLAVLEHVHAPEKFALACGRLLKPKGIGWLQGNPLWTSAQGHHLWLKDLPGSGNSYFFHANSPFEDWEHLCVKNREEGEAILRRKNIPENDIPYIVGHVLTHPHISRKTPTEIENVFANVFGGECRIIRKKDSRQPNEFFEKALRKHSRDDLLTRGIEIYFGNIAEAKPGM